MKSQNKPLTVGIHPDIPIDVYHADKTVVSSTGVKKAKKSSRHFAYYLCEPADENVSHFDFGNAFELALVDAASGTNEFGKHVAIKPTSEWVRLANEIRMKEGKPEYASPKASKYYKDANEQFMKTIGDRYVVDDVGDESMETITEMVKSCRADHTIWMMLEKTQYQLSFVWTDSETGLMMKTRPDIASNKYDVIVNIKTTLDSSPHGFRRQLAQLDYPLQACIEIRGAIETGYLSEVRDYYWLAVEKKPPFNAVLHRFQKSDIETVGDSLDFYVKRCAGVIKTMLDAGEKFDYTMVNGYNENADNPHGVIDVEMPLWYLNEL